MKVITLLFLNFVIFTNSSLAEAVITKSEILEKSSKCLKYPQKKSCKQLILQMEQVQLMEFEKNRFKCQSSILGLQTEIVEAYFFSKNRGILNSVMMPYVIKNC